VRNDVEHLRRHAKKFLETVKGFKVISSRALKNFFMIGNNLFCVALFSTYIRIRRKALNML